MIEKSKILKNDVDRAIIQQYRSFKNALNSGKCPVSHITLRKARKNEMTLLTAIKIQEWLGNDSLIIETGVKNTDQVESE